MVERAKFGPVTRFRLTAEEASRIYWRRKLNEPELPPLGAFGVPTEIYCKDGDEANQLESRLLLGGLYVNSIARG